MLRRKQDYRKSGPGPGKNYGICLSCGNKGRIILLGLTMLLFAGSCKESYTPKPDGYLKITYPEKAYQLYNEQEQYQFEIPVYAQVEKDRSRISEEGWINVAIPQLNGKIHLSYKPVGDQLTELITDCRELAYKHTVKAQGIEETPFIVREEKRFGMIYDLKGDVASAVQFFITDSTDHFLRGSLYFNSRPNRDSLNPVIDFLREDIIHLIETTRWKY